MRSLVVVAAAFAFAIPAARADCNQDMAAMRAKLAAVHEPAKQQEIDLLLAKAQEDDRAGRADLCVAAVEHAAALIK
jgi:hypothetical protein